MKIGPFLTEICPKNRIFLSRDPPESRGRLYLGRCLYWRIYGIHVYKSSFQLIRTCLVLILLYTPPPPPCYYYNKEMCISVVAITFWNSQSFICNIYTPDLFHINTQYAFESEPWTVFVILLSHPASSCDLQSLLVIEITERWYYKAIKCRY